DPNCRVRQRATPVSPARSVRSTCCQSVTPKGMPSRCTTPPLALSAGGTATVVATLAPSLEVVIQAVPIHRIDAHLASGGHAFVFTPLGKNSHEVFLCRHVSIWLQGYQQTRREGASLGVLAVASGALEHVLLPRLVER